MTIFQRTTNTLRSFFTIDGRANRTTFILMNLGVGFILFIAEQLRAPGLELIVIFALLWPALLITGRRLHDLNMSAWHNLFLLIPIVGVLFCLYLMFKKGDAGQNHYGIPPEITHRDDLRQLRPRS